MNLKTAVTKKQFILIIDNCYIQRLKHTYKTIST